MMHMQTAYPVTNKRAAILVALFLVLTSAWLAGCDTVGGENIVLQPKDVSFLFVFDTDGVQGNTLTVSANGSHSLGQLVAADGFTLDDVVAVEVTEVELERIQPTNQFLNDFLTSATFQLVSSSGAERTVASQSTFGASRSAAMNITGADVTSVTTGSGFTSKLSVAVQQMTANEYRLEVTDTD